MSYNFLLFISYCSIIWGIDCISLYVLIPITYKYLFALILTVVAGFFIYKKQNSEDKLFIL